MVIETEVKKSIQSFVLLAEKEIRLEAVYLFGSMAKGNAHEWSDIDLAIISPDFSGDSFEDSKLLFPCILQVNPSIEVHPFRPADFSSDNPFVQEIRNSGIRVH